MTVTTKKPIDMFMYSKYESSTYVPISNLKQHDCNHLHPNSASLLPLHPPKRRASMKNSITNQPTNPLLGNKSTFNVN
jgi:hypothetical protein